MKRTKTYRSPASAAIHETVAGLHELGIVDKQTMRGFDKFCLTPVRVFSPAEIRKLREHEQISQTALALHMNMSKESIIKWERGKTRPNGASLKLLSLIETKGLAAIT
ncbi:MAG: helix-turn-helix domain-containing protein [Acidobacteria bacterium]|nr:helix-turn-helix domain-containing protein [Acidobacteriota bacterium]